MDERQSTAAGKRQRRAAMNRQGFELNPPRCLNCDYFSPPSHGAPAPDGRIKVAYRVMRCKLGGFEVKPSSICDKWRGRDGEELEGA